MQADDKRLADDFFQSHSTIELARKLLGTVLCRRIGGALLRGMIVETEAYLGADDHASYSFGGRRTEANEPMYMPAGTCFVRFTYGLYHCFNLSSRDEGGAVLIRAAEPIEGMELMSELRREHPKASARDSFGTKPHQLANGPSKLCIALDIDRSLNRLDITTDAGIWIEPGPDVSGHQIVESTRIGISPKNPWASKLLRFYLKGFKSVSKL